MDFHFGNFCWTDIFVDQSSTKLICNSQRPREFICVNYYFIILLFSFAVIQINSWKKNERQIKMIEQQQSCNYFIIRNDDCSQFLITFITKTCLSLIPNDLPVFNSQYMYFVYAQKLTWIYKFCLFASKENKRYCNIFTWSKLPHKYKRVGRFVEQKYSNTVKI